MTIRSLHPLIQQRSGLSQIPTDPLGREVRTLTVPDASLRAKDKDTTDGIGFRGHAAIFNSPTQIGPKSWGWREQVAPGAFAKTITEADVRFLMNHNPDLVLARNKAEPTPTLRLSEDDIGLLTEAEMARTSYGEDLAISLERGDVSQMSFAFSVLKEEWEEDEDSGDVLRTLKEVKLYDVSAVTYPAYEDTDAGLRAAAVDALARSMNLSADQRRSLDHELDKIVRPTEPARTTQDDEQPEPAETTRGLELYRLRTRALGALMGEPAA